MDLSGQIPLRAHRVEKGKTREGRPPFDPRPVVVFDLDGTLVDSVGAIGAVINGMRAERGLPRLGLDALRPYVTRGGETMAKALLAEAWGGAAEALKVFRERYGAAPTPADSVYPGAPAALAALHTAGFGLAVFSNKTQGLCEKVLGELELAAHFAAIVGTGPETPHKPDATGYIQAVERAGGAVGRGCLVGDGEADQATAMRAGAPFIFVTWGYGELSGELPVAARAETFADVPGIAQRVLAGAAAA